MMIERTSSTRLAAASLLLSLAASPVARAADPPPAGAAAPAAGKAVKAKAGKPGKPGPDIHLPAGERAFNEDDFQTAITELTASMTLRPTAKAATLLGRAHFKQEQFDEARAAWQLAVGLEKKGPNKAELSRLIKSIEGLSSAKLRIDSFPEGATVYLDLKAAGVRGKTPVELSMRPGRHRVFVQLEGFDDAVAVPDPTALSGKTSDVMVTLRAKGCDAQLSSKLHEAKASLDGGAPEALPTTMRIPIGSHRIVFTGKAMIPKTREVECKDFKPLAIEEELQPLPDGIIAIKTTPCWEIVVDEKPVALAEAAQLRVRPGEHQVEVKEAGKTPWHAVVKVEGGQEVEVVPQPQVGQEGETGLHITAHPADALCFVDGEKINCAEKKIFRAGPHVVEARARGYHPHVASVVLPRGELLYVDARPVRRSQAPLALGVVFTAVAAASAGTAVWAHLEAGKWGDQSPNYKLYHGIEQGTWIGAGALGAAAVVMYGIQFGYLNRAGLEGSAAPAVRAAAAPLPGGGSLVFSGEF